MRVLLRRDWPQQLGLDEAAPEGCQDDGCETKQDRVDQQASTADHPGLEEPVAEQKQDMSEGSRAALIHVNAFGPHSLKILGLSKRSGDLGAPARRIYGQDKDKALGGSAPHIIPSTVHP